MCQPRALQKLFILEFKLDWHRDDPPPPSMASTDEIAAKAALSRLSVLLVNALPNPLDRALPDDVADKLHVGV